MVTDETKRPVCFGVLERVFPMGNQGLRHSPEGCMACSHKTACLREALTFDPGAKDVKEERVDRAYASGNLSFLSRWSRKKSLAGKK